jgi:hypothetical protein
MGYATVMNVPRVQWYADALEIYERVKPIRGRDPEIRPLGSRRDADTYSIRKSGDDVELVLYTTPVVTFKPDGNVELRTAGWSTVSTRQFIRQVLGISTHGEIKESIVTIGGNKYILPTDGECMTVRMNDKDQWCLASAVKTNFDWKLNRKASNNVRKRYAEFIDYLDGVSKLRRDMDNDEITVSYAEYAEAFGEQEKKTYNGDDTYKCVDLTRYTNSIHKHLPIWRKNDYVSYEDAANAFLKLITSGAHDDFYKASLILFAVANGGNMELWPSRRVYAYSRSVSNKLNEVLYKYHSDEVFDRVELPEGKLPKGKYKNWVNNKE